MSKKQNTILKATILIGSLVFGLLELIDSNAEIDRCEKMEKLCAGGKK